MNFDKNKIEEIISIIENIGFIKDEYEYDENKEIHYTKIINKEEKFLFWIHKDGFPSIDDKLSLNLCIRKDGYHKDYMFPIEFSLEKNFYFILSKIKEKFVYELRKNKIDKFLLKENEIIL